MYIHTQLSWALSVRGVWRDEGTRGRGDEGHLIGKKYHFLGNTNNNCLPPDPSEQQTLRYIITLDTTKTVLQQSTWFVSFYSDLFCIISHACLQIVRFDALFGMQVIAWVLPRQCLKEYSFKREPWQTVLSWHVPTSPWCHDSVKHTETSLWYFRKHLKIK